MYTHLQQREVFHLVFLRQFIKRIRLNTYALKDGCSLRFFFNSIRYSEDMGIDIQNIEIYKLKKIVIDILQSKTFQIALKPFQIDTIIPPNVETAKQTETVQRFKIHLLTSAGIDLFTKIEFSKRKLEDKKELSSVNENILYSYKQAPLIISHYQIEMAMKQKISALMNRASPQARDVFDMYTLYTQVQKSNLNELIKSFSPKELKRAEEIIFSINYEMFRDAVCSYLSDADRAYYDKPQMWESIQLKTSKILT